MKDAIAKIPSAWVTPTEFEFIAAELANESGEDRKTSYAKLAKQLEVTRRGKFENVVENRAEQWEYTSRFFDDLSQDTECHDQVLAAFCWQVIGNKGLPLLLEQNAFFRKTRIDDNQRTSMDRDSKKGKQKYRGKTAEICRDSIRSVLKPLSQKQLKKLASRLGISIDEIPELYEGASLRNLLRILNPTPDKVRFSRVHSVNDLSPTLALNKELAKWEGYRNFKNQQKELLKFRIRYHAAEFADPGLELNRDLKNLFGNPGSSPELIDIGKFVLDARSHRRINESEKMRRWFLQTLPAGKDGWKMDYFSRAGVELTDDQYRRLLMASNAATLQLYEAKSIREIVKINNQWLEKVGGFLVPKQSVRLFQTAIAEQGLVFFLVREDVGSEFGISPTQQRKILATAEKLKQEVQQQDTNLKQSFAREILESLPERSRLRLLRMLDTNTKNLQVRLLRPRHVFARSKRFRVHARIICRVGCLRKSFEASQEKLESRRCWRYLEPPGSLRLQHAGVLVVVVRSTDFSRNPEMYTSTKRSAKSQASEHSTVSTSPCVLINRNSSSRRQPFQLTSLKTT